MFIDELTWYDDLSSEREFIRGVNYRLQGDYRSGCPEGERIKPEVSWATDKHKRGVSVLVDLF